MIVGGTVVSDDRNVRMVSLVKAMLPGYNGPVQAGTEFMAREKEAQQLERSKIATRVSMVVDEVEQPEDETPPTVNTPEVVDATPPPAVPETPAKVEVPSASPAKPAAKPEPPAKRKLFGKSKPHHKGRR